MAAVPKAPPASRRRIKPFASNSHCSFAVRTEPIARIVMPFVLKSHGDAMRANSQAALLLCRYPCSIRFILVWG
jgi:hypothetical protein